MQSEPDALCGHPCPDYPDRPDLWTCRLPAGHEGQHARQVMHLLLGPAMLHWNQEG